MASSSINMYYPPMSPARRGAPRRVSCPSIPAGTGRCAVWHCAFRRVMICSAAQESTTATVTDKGAEGEKESVAEKAVAPPKPAVAKAAVKPLRELMEEDVIPSLKEALESQDDISLIELSFGDNRLEGSFSKKDVPYVFWAFFPDGGLTGPKGFSLSSYGSKVSTVEPFLNDEKKITSNHVVFWVVKRLAAQGILPVWKEE